MNYRKALNLAVFAAVAFAAVKATTLGWNFLSTSYPGGATRTSPAALERTVTDLAVGVGPRDLFNNNKARLRKAEDYVAAGFRAAGCEPRFQQYAAAGVSVKNIFCVKEGASAPGEVVVVGAHYDTFNNPGADDNASGVAGLLELAAHARGRKYARTVKFAAFVNEEPPFFRREGMGSKVWADAAAAAGEDVRAALVLEMIGYFDERPSSQRYPPLIGPFLPNKGNFIAQIADFRSRGLAGRVDAAFRKASALPLRTVALPAWVPGVDYSDHRSFWAHGWPAVMFTDTSFYRTPNYHKASDLPGTLNYQYMASLLDGLKAALDDLAGAPGEKPTSSPAVSPASSRPGPL